MAFASFQILGRKRLNAEGQMFHKLTDRFTLTGELVVASGVHIGAGLASHDPARPDNPIQRDARGRPYIPGSSLKGVCRSRVEAIARTLALDNPAIRCCAPFVAPCVPDTVENQQKQEKSAAAKEDGLCCRPPVASSREGAARMEAQDSVSSRERAARMEAQDSASSREGAARMEAQNSVSSREGAARMEAQDSASSREGAARMEAQNSVSSREGAERREARDSASKQKDGPGLRSMDERRQGLEDSLHKVEDARSRIKRHYEFSQELERDACSVCQIFGLPWLSSHVLFRDLHAISPNWMLGTRIRDGVGLHRERGIARSNIKYDLEVTEGDIRFAFELVAENLSSTVQRGLLAVGLLELARGAVPIGGRTSRGLGEVTLELNRLERLPSDPRSKARALATGRGVVKEGAEVVEELKSWARALREQPDNQTMSTL